MKQFCLIPLILCSVLPAAGVERTPAAAAKIVPPTPAWEQNVKSLAPAKPRVEPKAPRKLLVFSLATGFKHKVIPHVKSVMDILAGTGAFEVTHTNDIEIFAPDKLKGFDGVVLNNTCSKGPGRNLILDALAARKDLTDGQKQARAKELEESLIRFVADGNGLVLVHGAIVFLNRSEEFGEMVGGSFIMHPARQEITVTAVDPDHPLVAAFKGEAFVHNDEPYLFQLPKGGMNFRPLLEMDVKRLDKGARAKMGDKRHYVAWIKKYGKGRVFYVSPSHQPESYQSTRLLQFYLDGIQYALGDLPCDDSPVGGS